MVGCLDADFDALTDPGPRGSRECLPEIGRLASRLFRLWPVRGVITTRDRRRAPPRRPAQSRSHRPRRGEKCGNPSAAPLWAGHIKSGCPGHFLIPAKHVTEAGNSRVHALSGYHCCSHGQRIAVAFNRSNRGHGIAPLFIEGMA